MNNNCTKRNENTLKYLFHPCIFFFSVKKERSVLQHQLQLNLFEIYTQFSRGKGFSQCNLYCVSYRNGLKGFRHKTVDIYKMVAAAILGHVRGLREVKYICVSVCTATH